MIRKKVGTITLAVGLITIGALMLAQNFMELVVKDYFKYWPVLLIGLGIEIIVYMALYNREENVKVNIDGLCMVFIAAVAIISISKTSIGFNLPIRINGNTIINGVSYNHTVKETYVKDNISQNIDVKKVKIRNEFGEIKVLSGTGSSIRIEAQVQVKHNNEVKARAYAKDAIEIVEGETTEISPKSPSNDQRGDVAKAQIDFVIYVPKQVSAEVEGSFGDIRNEDLQGKVYTSNKHGKVRVLNIGSDTEIRNSFGDIEVKSIKGKVTVYNTNGKIRTSDIEGDAILETHFGDIDASKISGGVNVINNNGRVEIKDAGGYVKVKNSFGDVTASNIGGDIKVNSNNGKIRVDGAEGSADLQNSFGDIRLKALKINDAEVYAETKFGSIEGSGLRINKSGQSTVGEAKNGTGQYKIRVVTSNGSIDVE